MAQHLKCFTLCALLLAMGLAIISPADATYDEPDDDCWPTPTTPEPSCETTSPCPTKDPNDTPPSYCILDLHCCESRHPFRWVTWSNNYLKKQQSKRDASNKARYLTFQWTKQQCQNMNKRKKLHGCCDCDCSCERQGYD